MPQGPIPVRITNNASVGNSWFVNESTGDDSNPGNAQLPFASLDAALAAAKDNNNDVVYFYGTQHRSTSLAWNKNVNLVGLQAPSGNDRARITPASGLTQTQVTALHPLVNVTAVGMSFVNIGTFYGFNGVLTPPASSVCWAEAGGRNFYSGCQFLGGGDALMADLAGMRSITIGGGGEDEFVGCTFGLDTVIRATNANATMEIVGGAPRIKIRKSVFQSWCSDASDVHILIQAGGLDRYLMLQSCMLHNFTGGGGISLTAAISNAGGSPGGNVVLTPDCISVGAGAIATAGEVFVGQISAAGATTTGIGIHAT